MDNKPNPEAADAAEAEALVFVDEGDLWPDQKRRVKALNVASDLLRGGGGSVFGGKSALPEKRDITELIHLADYVIDGTPEGPHLHGVAVPAASFLDFLRSQDIPIPEDLKDVDEF